MGGCAGSSADGKDDGMQIHGGCGGGYMGSERRAFEQFSPISLVTVSHPVGISLRPATTRF